MRTALKHVIIGICVASASLLCSSQTKPTFREDVRLIEIYATVLDHSGHAVDGLTKDQFEIQDNGKPQPIRVFESTAEPLSCALLLDTTGSMRDSIPALRNASRELIDALRPADSVAVYSFAEQLSELQEMTADKVTAARALTRVRASGRTALFDSLSQLALALESKPGKKAIIVLTDGGDNASVLTPQAAADRVRKAGIPVFAVAEGEALQDQSATGLLRTLSEATGGRLYSAPHSKDIQTIFRDISRDLQSSYLLAISADAQGRTNTWHDLSVVVKNTSNPLRVRSRTGYFAQ